MGIRITCPNCQKQLNVKSFLAGKRGVCPDCGTKFDIPAGSEHNVVLEVDESEATVSARKTEVVRKQQSLEPPSISPAPVATQPVFPAAMPVAAPLEQTQTYVMPTVPAAYGHGHPHLMPSGVAPAMSPMAQPVMAAAAVAVRSDPIAQSPHIPWHICTPSGDQYGPVLGEALRQWIAERRITPDALLWREGWPDWQRADAVLLEFAPAQAAPPMAAIAVPLAGPMPVAEPENPFPIEPTRPSTVRFHPRRSRNTQAVVIIMLIIVLLILAPLLGYVLYQQL